MSFDWFSLVVVFRAHGRQVLDVGRSATGCRPYHRDARSSVAAPFIELSRRKSYQFSMLFDDRGVVKAW
jgi:hypothetical protein